LVTGHHARVRRHPEGYRLFAGRDSGKDQSYVLHMLGQTELARVLLPIGELTKDEVRAKASALGLRTATKPDSQDICFVTSGDYRDFLREHFPESTRPGDIVDGEGSVVGSHRGAAGFTIGQRRGLGISAAEPRYVVDIRPATATIVVGTRDELAVAGVRITEVSWVSGHPPAHLTVDLKVRYRSRPVPALIEGAGGEWTAWFDGESAAPGQAAVLYNGDEVLGGGTITEVIRSG
ncbi:MAG: tRNA 2-thiouridine(34) synthase MnmA, partial [Acidimicrobiia bacterium]|nr:tRNA 2-thiouridine(34) synthase MnmA [Acidimicrobiia bacterium]